MSLTFKQQLSLTLLDKIVVSVLVLLAGFAFNRMLENFKSQQSQALESLKSDLTRETEVARERRAALAAFAAKMSTGYHAMNWLSWKAKHDPQSFAAVDVTTYNNDMKRLFPELVAARIVLSSLSLKNQEDFHALAEHLIATDARVTEACIAWEQAASEGRADALRALGALDGAVAADEAQFLKKILELASLTMTTR